MSEENGQVSYLKNGEFSIYDNYDDLQNKVIQGISEVTGDNFNKLTGSSEEEQKKIQGN